MARTFPDAVLPVASAAGWGPLNGRLAVFAKHVVHPEHSEKNGVVTQPFPSEEAPNEASSYNAKTTPTSRLELVRRTVDDGWRYQAVAEGYGVSVRTVAKWVQRFRQLGAAGLEDGSSRPQQTPHITSPVRVTFIRQLREQHGLPAWANRPRVADAAVHGRGLVATLGIEPAAYRPVGAHPALRVAAPGGFVAR